MGGLGRVFDVVYTASGNAFSLKNCSGVTLLVKCSSTTTTSIALVGSTAFSGGTTANWTTANGFGQTAYWYQNTVNTGTAAWTKQTAVWTTNSLAVGATSGYLSAVEIFASQLADTYDYLTVTGTNCTVTALLHDLTVQRNPANLAILGA
jgi:hypothetical protein